MTWRSLRSRVAEDSDDGAPPPAGSPRAAVAAGSEPGEAGEPVGPDAVPGPTIGSRRTAVRNMRYASATAEPGSLKVAKTAAGGACRRRPGRRRDPGSTVAGISARTRYPSVS